MFTPAPMREVNLFVQAQDIQQVTAVLAQLDSLELEPEPEAGAGASEWTGLVGAYLSHERRLRELLDLLEIERTAESAPENLPENLDVTNDVTLIAGTLQHAEDAIGDWRQRRQAGQEQAAHLDVVIDQLRLLAPLGIPVEHLAHFRTLHLVAGTMPPRNLARIQTALFRIPFVIIPSHQQAGRTLVFAATTHEYAPILDRALRSAFFEPIPLPQDVCGLPVEALAELEQRQVAARVMLDALEQERRQLTQTWRSPLLAAWNRARSDGLLADTMRRFSQHGQIYLIAGWAPATEVEPLTGAVQIASGGRTVIEIVEPDRARAGPPTLLHNARFFGQFEWLVTTFGYPTYNELDPTPLVAITFLVMFGMMFGDVGHGLLLAAAGLWLQRRRKGLAVMGPLLCIFGLSAALFGLLYGTVFGLPLLPVHWLRPLDGIMDILLAAVLAGVVLLNIGFGLHLVNAWRARDWEGLLFDKNGLAGCWLYWGLLGGGVAVWRGILPVWLWILLAGVPAALIMLREPLWQWRSHREPLVENSWGEFAVLAFFELFEAVISYIGNTLSFIRLGAFAVAHEGLSQVVLLLAAMNSGIGGWIIFALGTVLLVGFEGLIVGIQALRLEYYEFFGKFFRGQGRPFTPLRLPQLE